MLVGESNWRCCWRCKRESLFGSFIGICIETAFYTNRKGVLNGIVFYWVEEWKLLLNGLPFVLRSIWLTSAGIHDSRSNEEVPCLATLFGVQRRSGNVLIETHSNCTFGTWCGFWLNGFRKELHWWRPVQMGKTISPNLGRIECVTVNELLRYCNICCPWLNEQRKEIKMRSTAIRNQFKEEGS